MNGILVTGGAGYVGYTLVEELAKKYPASQIIVYDNFSKGRLESIGSLSEKNKNIIIIPGEKADIRDEENFERALDQYKPEAVINLAAIVSAFTTNREGKDRETEIVNYESAVNIARISKIKGVKIFIQQSTVSIYSRGEELKEESEKAPISMYGRAKLKAEKEILDLNDNNFKSLVIRPATIVGYNPSFRYETIINLCCIRSVYKIMINIFESALNDNKTYLDVRDNAKAVIFALENIEQMKNGIFNLTSFHANLKEVLELIKQALKEDFPYEITCQKTISQQVYTINSDRIKSLGFEPEGKLKNIIQDTISNLKRIRDSGF